MARGVRGRVRAQAPSLSDTQRDMSEYIDKDTMDRYNTLEANQDKNQYKKIINAKIALAPSTGETLEQYIQRIKIYQKIARDKNWNTHVDNPYKTWHTHKNPMGCFMCDDTQFISVLVQVLECMLDDNLSFKFK